MTAAHHTFSRLSACMSSLLLLSRLSTCMSSLLSTCMSSSLLLIIVPACLFHTAAWALPQGPSDSVLSPVQPENSTTVTVTVQLGSTAYLPCQFPYTNNSNNLVSWIRLRDMHILTAGILSYTRDARFKVRHSEDSKDRTLQILKTARRDAGTYECHMSTRTDNGTYKWQQSSDIGITSKLVNLTVEAPRVDILGNTELYLKQGSTINLICMIESLEPPNYVFWYHNEKWLMSDDQERVKLTTQSGNVTHSTLTITSATYTDSGNYTCSPENIVTASARVYVIHDEDKMTDINYTAFSGATSLNINFTATVGCLVLILLWGIVSSR